MLGDMTVSSTVDSCIETLSSSSCSSSIFSIVSRRSSHTQHSMWVYVQSASVWSCLQHHVFVSWPNTTLSVGLHLVCLCLLMSSASCLAVLAKHNTQYGSTSGLPLSGYNIYSIAFHFHLSGYTQDSLTQCGSMSGLPLSVYVFSITSLSLWPHTTLSVGLCLVYILVNPYSLPV